ncbi:MAG: hypothetical protein KDA96_24805, partial [Planctomycetaceae bacterium]|nr:hypothetical protein [Planctomycetaceae bacterium]
HSMVIRKSEETMTVSGSRSFLLLLLSVFTPFLQLMDVESCAAADVTALPAVDPVPPGYRVPIDAAVIGDHIFVANSRTGTISSVNQQSLTVHAEWKVGESLSAIQAWGDRLLVLDDHAHQVHVIHPSGRSAQLTQSLSIAAFPVNLAIDDRHSNVAVASLWSRRLTLLAADGTDKLLRVRHVVDLPFAPRCVEFLPDHRLAVADSFGGNLAVINTLTGTVESSRRLSAHNIRGMQFDAQNGQLLISHQALSDEVFTSYERVFWGTVMQNGLQSIALESLLDASDMETPEQDAYDPSYSSSESRYPLGTPSVGSGDPGDLTVTKNDRTLIVLSGVHQVAWRNASHLPFERIRVGRRPEAVCLDDSQEHAFVVNRFDDSISVISLTSEKPEVQSTVSLGNQRELTEPERGEQFFYDATVSLDGWYSCHSCHTDGHTNGLLADTLGDEGQGAPKKVLSLLGTGQTEPWAWNGSKPKLEDQISTSLVISMQTPIRTDQLPVSPLKAYLLSLAPPPSVDAARGTVSVAQRVDAGRERFRTAGCIQCHEGREYSSSGVFDVGIHDETGGTEFNPPSLRAVSQRAPYFHDGRAKTLRDVLISGHHNSEDALKEEDIGLLEDFLNSL